MPLLITDDEGKMLYRSRGIPRDAAVFGLPAEEGLLSLHRKNLYMRRIILGGRAYRFYLDFDRLTEYYGIHARRENIVALLFDLQKLAATPKVQASLHVIAHWFADSYAQELRADGAHIELRRMNKDWFVCVPPNALLLCIALLVRLCAFRGSTVRLSAVRDGDSVTVFADAPLGKKPKKPPEVLRVLLYETAAAVGFSVSHTEKNGCCTWSLCLAPPDIGTLGLKHPLLASYEKNCRAYVRMLW